MNQQVINDSIKRLRELTGSSITLCKEALMETNGDMEKAVLKLKKSSEALAEKKIGRNAGAGIVDAYIHGNRKIGVLLELRCETDFVARTQKFQDLAHNVTLHIAGMNPSDCAEMLAQSYVKDPSITIEELIKQNSGNFGEKIEVARFSRFEL